MAADSVGFTSERHPVMSWSTVYIILRYVRARVIYYCYLFVT